MSIKDEVGAFFASYIDAFARNDADALSVSWDEIGLFPSPTGNFAMERKDFLAHLMTLMDFYRRQGVVRPEGELVSVDELFPDVVQARIAYRMLGEGDELVAVWDHVYILRRTDRWRVSLTIADGEMAAWAARGAQL